MSFLRIGSVACCTLFASLLWQPGAAEARGPTADATTGTGRQASPPPWLRRRRKTVRVKKPAASPFEIPTGAPRRKWPRNHVGRPLTAREARLLGIRPKGMGLLDPSRWPREPKTPARLDRNRFAGALGQLCPPWTPPGAPATYTEWILAYAKQFDVDPALIGAVIYQQSRCESERRNSWGVGLAMINHGMHAAHVKGGQYRYAVRVAGRWQRRHLTVGKFKFKINQLIDPEANIYFTAALLSVFKAQCPAIDRGFRSPGHRHYVSHFVYGDRVRNRGPEDQILRARRRLLEYYTRTPGPALGRYKKLTLGCPVDGCPRKVTSAMGDPRDNGQRKHKGLDVLTDPGEPVRAVAQGEVVFAGVDLAAAGMCNLPPKIAPLVPGSRTGKRGLLVIVRHDHGLESAYMHLSGYTVSRGHRVRRGQLLGYVGRTGIRISDAHLHFELRVRGKAIDPLPHLRGHLFGPDATAWGRGRLEQRARRRYRRQLRAIRRSRANRR